MSEIEKVNFCPVCGKPDGVYKETKGTVYICGRYQSECKACKAEGWDFEVGTGAPASLSYHGKAVDLYNKKVKRPYKDHVTEDCFH